MTRHAERRGHGIRLGVRVPARPPVALAMGLDPVAWARQGSIDVLVAAPRWATIDFDIPLSGWRAALADSRVTVLGGLEILLAAHPHAPRRVVTAAEARGAACQILHDGADGVYLFNFFPLGPEAGAADDWRRAQYCDTLRSLGDLAQLARTERRHVITYADVTGPEGSDLCRPALPAAGTQLRFDLGTGPEPPASAAATLTVLLAHNGDTLMPPAATVNGKAAVDLEADVPEPGGRRLTYRIPPGTLQGDGPNRLELSSRGGPAVCVEYVDIRVAPPVD
jgi:hypothetical protein